MIFPQRVLGGTKLLRPDANDERHGRSEKYRRVLHAIQKLVVAGIKPCTYTQSMNRALLIFALLLCLLSSSIEAAADDDTLPGFDIPWGENEVTKFPRQHLGWWETYLVSPIQGIQFLPNGTMLLMAKNPINRSTNDYRVVRVIGDNIYLVYKSYSPTRKETNYEYLWLEIYPASRSHPSFTGIRMAFLTSGSITPEEFNTQSPQELWQKFPLKRHNWSTYGRYLR